MAKNTDPKLQKQIIYSVYVRSHTPEGTFRAVIPDLDRIRALGTDIIWFMPIHPIGVKGKKGSLGCPYANRDYRSVNPAYGTMEDFRALAEEIHKRGMKVMIDVVYNHTSPDSILFEQYLNGKASLSHWLDMLNMQEAVYPKNYNKLRFLENHDQPRIASFVTDESELENFTALLYFLKGTTLLYAGQEVCETHKPSLFEREPVNWQTGRDLTPLLKRLGAIKHDVMGEDDLFTAASDDENDIALLEREGDGIRKLGVFSLRAKSGRVPVNAPDGTYENLIDGSAVTVAEGTMLCEGRPVIFTVKL